MRGNGSPVEPVPGTDEQLLPPPPPGPGTLGALRPPALNVFLFFLTFASAFVAGAGLHDTPLTETTPPGKLRPGLGVFSAPVFFLIARPNGPLPLVPHPRRGAPRPV